MSKKLIGMVLAGVSLLVCAAAPAMADTVGGGDPFELTFDASGHANLIACTGTCTLGPYSGTAVTNVSLLGGNGFEYALPESVGTGIVKVLNSSSVQVGALYFIDPTDLIYIVSGTVSNYGSGFFTTANASGSFTYLGPYPTDNQYNGTIPNAVGTVPLPAALPLFASGLGALGLLGWRRKRKAMAA